MLVKRLQPDFLHEDERGIFIQLVSGGYKQYNVLFSKKNVIRGNHYHKQNEEAFFVIAGKLQVNAKKENQKENQKETYVFQTGDMFRIPPMVVHEFVYFEDTWLASMYSAGVENKDGTKDIYSEQEIQTSKRQ